MTRLVRLLPVAMAAAILFSAPASRGAELNAWEGTWSGTLGKTNPWPVSVSIANGKVVSFTEKGVPFDVQFTKITPDAVYFGDQNHYSMKLIKTGDTTASIKVHGRHGIGAGALTKS
jgi:hypothetical protein